MCTARSVIATRSAIFALSGKRTWTWTWTWCGRARVARSHPPRVWHLVTWVPGSSALPGNRNKSSEVEIPYFSV
eukprot:3096556-Prymnesium_polylepis.1